MKFIVAFILAVVIAFQNVPPLAANPEQLPEITGEAAYLIDVQSGQTLFSKNGNEKLAPASTTKIMTGLLAIEQGTMDEIVTASPTMLDYKIVYGTRIYLEPGEQLSLEDMLYALLLNSANDAAVAIAEHIGGDLSQFVKLMNQRARSLGLQDTTFKNPSGLTEEGHLTTAHDLARIAQAAYANPVFRDYIKTKTHVIPRSKENVPIEMINENKLLWRDPSITGMKTGYTAAAGNCLVTSASREGRDLIAVILKSPGREIYTDMQKLLDYGFNQYENHTYKSIGDKITTIQVQNQEVNLLAQNPIWITQKKGESAQEPNIRIISPPPNLSEVETGQVLTQLEVWEGDNRIAIVPLTADRTVKSKVNVLKNKKLWLVFSLILLAGGLLYGASRRKTFTLRRLDRNRRRRRGTNS